MSILQNTRIHMRERKLYTILISINSNIPFDDYFPRSNKRIDKHTVVKHTHTIPENSSFRLFYMQSNAIL